MSYDTTDEEREDDASRAIDAQEQLAFSNLRAENMRLALELGEATAFGDYARLRIAQFEKMLTSIESSVNMLVEQRNQRDAELVKLRERDRQAMSLLTRVRHNDAYEAQWYDDRMRWMSET